MPKRGSLAVAVAVAVTVPTAIALHARYRQPYCPVLERIEIPAPTGHEALAGLRIGFITDTHIGPFTSGTDIERAVALLLAEAPDLVLLGGDYISESPRFATEAAAVLARLPIAAPLGCLAVLGNHDISTDAAKVTSALKAVGIRVLRNQSVRIETPGGPLWVAGIDETILGDADVAETFANVPRAAAVISLWHEPDGAPDVACRAFAQFSGHSHGGQIRLPGIGPLALPPGGRTYPAGRYQIGPMALYTARGAGVYRPAVRFNCPPEVTIVTLTS